MDRSESPFKVIVNADDFGPNGDVSTAILDAFDKGLVTSTSVIVNLPGAEPWITELARRCLPAGIHLNIFSGRPVSDPKELPSLVDSNGNFRRFHSLHAMEGQIDANELLREFRSQAERLVSLGVVPTHIDNHRHEIYFCPKLFSVVAYLAEEFSLPVRLPLECNLDRYGEALASLAQSSVDGLKVLQDTLRTICDERHVRRPTSFVPDFLLKSNLSCAELVMALRTTSSGTVEVCSHPSYGSESGLHDMHVLQELHAFHEQHGIIFEWASFRDV